METSPEKPESREEGSEPGEKEKNPETENLVETRLHNRLVELKNEISDNPHLNTSTHKDSPFTRMLYSIPVFVLFWLVYWFIFLRK